MASPSTVITLGYGSFGSVNLVTTLGYGPFGQRETQYPLCASLSIDSLDGSVSISSLSGSLSIESILSGSIDITSC